MSAATEQRNFKEFAAERRWSLLRLAQHANISYDRMRDTIAGKGEVTLKESAVLCDLLGCDVETLRAVLDETERRPGEKDARGRKKKDGGGSDGNEPGK